MTDTKCVRDEAIDFIPAILLLRLLHHDVVAFINQKQRVRQEHFLLNALASTRFTTPMSDPNFGRSSWSSANRRASRRGWRLERPLARNLLPCRPPSPS